MNLLEISMWWGTERDELVYFKINNGLSASISRLEIIDADDYERLMFERIRQLIWLGMPVHE